MPDVLTPDSRLGIPHVLRASLTIFRARFARVAGTAVVVFVPIGMLEAYAAHADRTYANHGGTVRLVLSGGLYAAMALATLGGVFYGGYLDAAVGEDYLGHGPRSVANVLRHLPYRRLVAADLALTALEAVAGVLFVVPALVLATLLCIVGPLVNIEGRSVRRTLVRSARLVAPHFLLAFCVVTLPTLLEHELVGLLELLVIHRSPLEVLVGFGVAAAFVFGLIGVIEVTLAHELVVRDRATSSVVDATSPA